MGTKVWGPPLWKTLHFIALGYPSNPCSEQREVYKHFFTNLHHVIPCSICATNYKKHLAELNIDEHLDNSAKLFEWTVKLHNIVNNQNGSSTWTVEDAKRFHMNELKNGHGPIYGTSMYQTKNVQHSGELFIMPLMALLIAMATILIATIYFLKQCRILK